MQRRSFLRSAGLTGLGVVAGILAMPAPPDGPATDRAVAKTEPPPAAEGWTDTSIRSEDRTPIARYQYRRDGYRRSDPTFVPTAPINVVIVPATEAGGLERTMAVLDDAGWVSAPEEYTRYAWDRTTEEYVVQQATAAETYYGTSGRFHVRCWYFEGVVSMQAHEDAGPRPKHTVASYERGRRAMESIFDAAGWSVSPTAIDLGNDEAPDRDGRASLLIEPEPEAAGG